MRATELSVEEFNTIQAAVRHEFGSSAPVEEPEAPDGFPYPRTSVCAALANDSIVIGGDGLHYRCGLQAGESHRAVGSIRNGQRKSLPMLNEGYPTGETDQQWWQNFDPTALPNCGRCSFLPICWGGCPKRHLEKDQHALVEQGAYWRTNLARLISAAAGTDVPPDFSYTEQDQFRS
jgi:uncharacterized protein